MKAYLKELNEISYKYLTEAGFDYSKKGRGEVEFTKTDGSEFHIQSIIEEYAIGKGIKPAEAKKFFDDTVAETMKKMEKSQLINGTMMDNVAESVAFDMLSKIPIEDVKFDLIVFQSIFDEVKTDFPEFYPLSNAFEPKGMKSTLWFTPDKLDKRFADVDTAACTPDAKLIFNIPFMTQLMKFAKLKGLKADPKRIHGKKYVSQGGYIPDEYVYCEFVLMHEIMHYAHGDFYFEKEWNLKGSIVNILGDFISNYKLIKNGFAQLPMGLFSEEFNYDNHNSYKKMYEIIEEELKKLPPQDRKRMEEQLEKMGDEMPKDGEGYDSNQDQDQQKGEPQKGGEPGEGEPQPGGEPGEGEPQPGGEPGEGEPQPGGEPGEGEPQPGGEPGEGEPQPGGELGDPKKSDDGGKDKEGEGSGSNDDPDKKPSKEEKDRQKEAEQAAKDDMKDQEARAKEAKEKDKTSQKIPESIDDMYKKAGEKLDKAANDIKGRQERKDNAPKPGDLSKMMQDKQKGTGKGKASADGNPYDIGERVYKPRLNWKAMLKKMVPSGVIREESITTPDRRSAAQTMVSISQTGTGRMKAGEKEEPGDKKGLCFLLDNSGSTMGKIGEMQGDIMRLIESQSGKLGNDLYVMKFSNDAHFFKVDIKKKKYGRITSIGEFVKKGKIKVKAETPIATLFKSTLGSKTVLSPKITMAVKTLIQHKFNVILFSDTDIVDGGDNQDQLKQLFSLGKKQMALIGKDSDSYKAYVKVLGSKHQISHL